MSSSGVCVSLEALPECTDAELRELVWALELALRRRRVEQWRGLIDHAEKRGRVTALPTSAAPARTSPASWPRH